MTHPGLLGWANTVRLTMAGDPGRQAFQDQVQAIGYLFLDDYLDSILSGAKQGPLIELVKTPGRKKALSRRSKPGPSKLSSTVLFEINCDGENVRPVTNSRDTFLTTRVDETNKMHNEKPQRTALLPIQPANKESSVMSLSSTSVPPITTPQSSLLPSEHNQLSIIAEDEEPSERVQLSNSVHDVKVMEPSSLSERPSLPSSANFENPMGDTLCDTQEHGSGVEAVHSLPLDISESEGKDEIIELVDDRKQMVVDVQDPIEGGGDAVDDNITFSSQKLPEKIALSFPTLPDPVPLRKSTRVRDPSINTNMLGAATPGAAGAKRTSWLSKAREAKALEGTVKKVNTPLMPALSTALVSFASLPQGKKRKSGETLDGTGPKEAGGERIHKVAKISEVEVAPRRSKEDALAQIALKRETVVQGEEFSDANSSQKGVLDMLKRTVEGLGVRTTETTPKGFGGNTVSILAEAKAAAEARLAARDRKEKEATLDVNDAVTPAEGVEDKVPAMAALRGGPPCVSDLFPREGRVKEKHKPPEKVFQKAIPTPIPVKEAESNCRRTSTTLSHSPPTQSATSVFTKPVFVPPVAALLRPASPTTQEALFRPHPPKGLVLSSTLGLGSHLESSPTSMLPAQSSLDRLQSETIFDTDHGPAWMPGSQNMEYTTHGSQPQICDEDDSWPVDEKLAAGVQWTYGASKDDSMTWSTFPSQSQRGDDTEPVTAVSLVKDDENSVCRHNATDHDVDVKIEKALISPDTELEEIVLGCKSTVGLVQQPDSTQSQSQISLASSGSSQSQIGFLGQASKFLSNALGTGKKKPEVKKVLQMAAVAARKQQEEADKKAARLKEMDIRRQQAIQRKAEEEKAKTMEEERKMKEETERRKKEQTEKRLFKPSKREDDTKKRKVDLVPSDKKNEVKKPAPSVLLGKSHLKHASKLPAASSTSTHAFASSTMAIPESGDATQVVLTPLQHSTSQKPVGDDFTQPSQLVQSQMAARAKAQIEASKHVVPSESIELPDINSEYSDSEDEDRKRTYDPPHWAQSPELRQALEQQSTINPDNIFGAIRPLRMEEIFKTKTSRFRARSSSANWTGSDRLTVQEELEYARRMGFR